MHGNWTVCAMVYMLTLTLTHGFIQLDIVETPHPLTCYTTYICPKLSVVYVMLIKMYYIGSLLNYLTTTNI